MNELYDKIRPNLRPVLIIPYKTPINKPFLKEGGLSNNTLSWFGDKSCLVDGPFSRIEWEEPNLKSDKQLKELLFELGWKPDEWNYKKDGKLVVKGEDGKPIKTSPKLTESSYDSLSIGIGPDIALYLKVSTRLSQLEGLISNIRDDGRITAQANPLGTPTGRFRHSVVVNIPKANHTKDESLLWYPEGKVFFGTEIRSLFIAKPGYKLVGHDASQLELRMFGHFLGDPDLIYEIEEGDFHDVFWEPLKDFVDTRDNAKTTEYAYLFGAQDYKLGNTVSTIPKGWSPEKTGKEVRRIIHHTFPSMRELDEKVKRASKRGYLIGLDGRKLWVRKQHAALNTLCQGNGAIVMKTSMCFLYDWIKRFYIDAKKVGDFHDEGQHEVIENQAELLGNLAVKSIVKAGEYYELKCKLSGEYKIGNSWAETH